MTAQTPVFILNLNIPHIAKIVKIANFINGNLDNLGNEVCVPPGSVFTESEPHLSFEGGFAAKVMSLCLVEPIIGQIPFFK